MAEGLSTLLRPRGGARRGIPWEFLGPPASPAEGRVRRYVAGSWWARAKQEHMAVGVFSILASEVAEVGPGERRVAW